MTSIYHKLRANGYSPLPIKDKYPCEKQWYGNGYTPMKNWNRFNQQYPTPNELDAWATWEAGVGIALGELSGVVALDLDNDIDGLHDKIAAIIPNATVKKVGQKGYTAFFKYDPLLFYRKYTWDKAGVRVAELLTTGQQTVVPPTIHPQTKQPYYYITEATLENTPQANLPTLTKEQLLAIDDLFKVEKPPTPTPTYYPPSEDDDHDDLESALNYIDSDNYDSWVQTGMAIKQTLGNAGFSVWDRWSQGSTKYNAAGMQKKWDSFERSDRTVKSIYFEARQRGYVPLQKNYEPKENYQVEIVAGGNLLPILKEEVIFHQEVIPAELLNAPGLIGRTMEYILASALYPQPVLALAAAINAVGTIMAHKVQADIYGLRTNIYNIGIAPSSAGKDHARAAVKRIFTAAGLEKLITGIPKSSTAVPKMVMRNNGKCLILWDEIGRGLKAICSEKASGHEAQITTYLMYMYNSSQEMYTGDEYASNKDQGGRCDIDQPCMNIYGTTVANHFYASLREAEVEDGFLPRWLVFYTDRFDEAGNSQRASNAVPQNLIDEYLAWNEAPTDVNRKMRNGGELENYVVNPPKIQFTPPALKLIEEYMLITRRKTNQLRIAGLYAASAIWGRAGEHAIKLSLLAHEKGGMIEAGAVEWATALTSNRLEWIVDALKKHMSGSDHERNVRKVEAMIKEAGRMGISSTVLTRKTQFLNGREREDVLQTLVSAGLVERIEEKEGKFKTQVYKIIP